MKFISKDMGIDLGTANTLVYLRGKGVVLREPSVVAVDTSTNTIKAIGEEARRMIGRTSGNIVAIRPLKDGVIADYDRTTQMIKRFIEKVVPKSTFTAPRIVICFPSGVTSVEKKAIKQSAEEAGARQVLLLEEPRAAAIGAGLPVDEPTGNMIVDIGGGTSEIAVISLSGIVTSKSLRVAGDDLDQAIIMYIKKEFNLLIGERTAEAIKLEIGSAYKTSEEDKITRKVKGRDLITGLPNEIEITQGQVREALKEPITAIVDAIKYTLERTPPELSSDIMVKGIMLAGGGAMLNGIDKFINNELHITVHIAENPLDCVAIGAGKALEFFDKLALE